MKRVIVSSAFDDVRFADFRFLEEGAKLGSLRMLLWSDAAVAQRTGGDPKFPLQERKYFAESIRFIDDISVVDGMIPQHTLPDFDGPAGDVWAVREADDAHPKQVWAREEEMEYRVIPESALQEAPRPPKCPDNPQSDQKKVVVTGCYDWFHTGHVRFFEECAEFGDLYMLVGNDENVKQLKGPHHPLFPAVQRRFIVGAIRFVKLALISSGMGWLDGEPEFLKIKPDIYAVNEDGDKPEKRAFCEKNGIEYRVLARAPKPGLPKRQSTDLRGF